MLEGGFWGLEVVVLIPNMVFSKLIPDFWFFEVDYPFDLEPSQDKMNLLDLLFAVNNSIPTVEFAHDQILLFPAAFLKHFFISFFEHVFIVISFTDQQCDLVNHDCFFASMFEI